MRGTCIRLRPGALAANLALARRKAGQAGIIAMVKANGYGHGLVQTAHAFAGADRLGVALMEEARYLRATGITTPLLVAEGFFDAKELHEAVALGNIACVVHAPWQVALLLQEKLSAELEIWLKLDSGMHRLGMPAAKIEENCQLLARQPNLAVTTLMTHLACADKPEDKLSGHQIDACTTLASRLGLQASIANSAALLRYPDSRAHQVRPGIMLYGSSPYPDRYGPTLGLAVTQLFTARLMAINEVVKGDAVGYGSRWTAKRDSRIGVVAVGYGDGYPRHAPDGTPVAVKTASGVQRAPLAGCVSMDMITLDLTDVAGAKPGDEVELWGDHVCVDEVAAACQTISYELFCQLTDRPQRLVET